MEELVRMSAFIIGLGYSEVLRFMKGDEYGAYFLVRDKSDIYEVKIVHETGATYFRMFLDDDAVWIHEGTYKGGVKA